MQRWHRQIVMASAGVGAGTLLWYMVVIWQGATISSASDVFEPIAVVWSLGAIAGIFALSWQWDQRRARRARRALSGAEALRSSDGAVSYRSSVPASPPAAAVDHATWRN